MTFVLRKQEAKVMDRHVVSVGGGNFWGLISKERNSPREVTAVPTWGLGSRILYLS